LGQHFVSSQLLSIQQLKIGHCDNLFFASIEYRDHGDGIITCYLFPIQFSKSYLIQ